MEARNINPTEKCDAVGKRGVGEENIKFWALLIFNMNKEIFADDCKIKIRLCRDVPPERLYQE